MKDPLLDASEELAACFSGAGETYGCVLEELGPRLGSARWGQNVCPQVPRLRPGYAGLGEG